MNKIQYSKITFNTENGNQIVEADFRRAKNLLGDLDNGGLSETAGFDNALGKILKLASNKQVDFNKSKSIYRFSNLTLSRDRVAILKDKYGTKVVRDKNKADLWVISDKYLETLTSYRWAASLYPSENFFNEIQNRKSEFSEIAFTSLMEYEKSLIDLTDENIETKHYIELDTYFYGSSIVEDIKKALAPYKLYIHSGNYLTEESLEEYNILKANLNKLATDVVINTSTGEDSVALNFENYTQIAKMLQGNTEDMNVAMTLMANCKIESSKTWLSILFYDNTYSMRGNKMWNQVAFKTLKKMFDKYVNTSRNNYYRDINDVKFLTSSLVRDGILNSEAEEMMLDRTYKCIMNYMNAHGDTKILLDRKDIKLDVIKVAEESDLVGDVAGALV